MNHPSIQKNKYFIAGASIDSKKLKLMRYANTIIQRAGVIRATLPENINPKTISIGKINRVVTEVRVSFKNNQTQIQKKKRIVIIYDIKLQVILIMLLSDQAKSNNIMNT